MHNLTDLQSHDLGTGHLFWTGRLPEALILSPTLFGALWEMHPPSYHDIKLHGRLVKTPRWQQAYGRDYHYTGQTNKALPVPELLRPILEWSVQTIDDRLNGILINWYDGKLGHYIGRHRDSIADMVLGGPIVTVSFGEKRVFRLRPWRGPGYIDFPATNGCVFVMPYDTNQSWTHEVPSGRRYTGRRISVTLRAFKPDSD